MAKIPKTKIVSAENPVQKEKLSSVKTKIFKETSSLKNKFENDGIIRIKTGIKGFDELVEGGLPKLSDTLICGAYGTGKTLFGLEFIYRGITQYNENGIIITFEESKEELFRQAHTFGWDFEELEKQKKLKILFFDILGLNTMIFEEIKKAVIEINAKRLLFDSLTHVTINANGGIKTGSASLTYSPQQFIYYFIHKLWTLGTTNIFISDILDTEGINTSDAVSPFICDNVVLLRFQTMGGPYSRTLLIRKSRSTKNNEDIHPLEIGREGIVLHNLE
jgi:circadian clock protein KaiC